MSSELRIAKLYKVQWYFADFTLRYALRATQDEIGREKRILSSGSLREPRIEGRFSRLYTLVRNCK